MITPEEREQLTFDQALDKVKEWRRLSREMVGSLYPNVLQSRVQEFLEWAQHRWGERFMKCVEREKCEEAYGDVSRTYKGKGLRDSRIQIPEGTTSVNVCVGSVDLTTARLEDGQLVQYLWRLEWPDVAQLAAAHGKRVPSEVTDSMLENLREAMK